MGSCSHHGGQLSWAGDVSLSIASPGEVLLKRGSQTLSTITLFPTPPSSDRVLSWDQASGALLWKVDQTGGGGGTADGNDFCSSVTMNSTSLVLGFTHGGTLSTDLALPLDNRYVQQGTFNNAMLSQTITTAQSIAVAASSLQTQIDALTTALAECTRIQVSVGSTTTWPIKFLEILPPSSSFSQGSNIGTSPSYVLTTL